MSGARVWVHAGDLIQLPVDAIVNAANERLTPGGGVCGAIHRAAGPGLAEECAKLGHCPTGEARITRGYRLPARHVIHAVGPIWQGGRRGEDDLLASCYRAALRLAREQGIRTIAFPAISTGIYGFPLERATRIAVETVRDCLGSEPGLEEVIFAAFGPEAEEAYERALGRERGV